MRPDQQAIQTAVFEHGFAIVENVFSPSAIERMRSAVDASLNGVGVRKRNGTVFAIRNLLDECPGAAELARSAQLQNLVGAVLPGPALLTRAILFDKNPRANWSVPWHQDTTIAVQVRLDAPGFGPWSQKAGTVHVRPPAAVLEQMLTARIHLDDCGAEDGALLVIPGSHESGFLEPPAMRQASARSAHHCCIKAGGVLLMRPLLVHSSHAAINPTRRRIVHLEFACEELPFGLQWANPLSGGRRVGASDLAQQLG